MKTVADSWMLDTPSVPEPAASAIELKLTVSRSATTLAGAFVTITPTVSAAPSVLRAMICV
ncbi:hypothetical protein D3C83_205460 [compost metagenome]